jgi:hypothetical protein
LKEAGILQQFAMAESLYGLSLRLFRRHLHWEPDELEVFLAMVRNDLLRDKTYFYWPWYALTAIPSD